MRRTSRLGRAAAAVVLLGLLLTAGGQRLYAAGGFTLKAEDVEIKKVFQMIARAGKFNILLDKSIRGKMPVELQDVPYRRALELLAKINKYQVREIKDLQNTFVIAPSEVIEKEFDKALSLTYILRFAKAEEMAGILSKALGKSANVSVEVDKRTNSVVVNAAEEVLEKVKDLIRKLDRPVPQVLIDCKIVNVNSDVTKDMGFDWDWGPSQGEEVKNPGNGQLFTVTENSKKNYNADAYSNPPSGVPPFTFGDFFRSNLLFDTTFHALEVNSLARTLASPRLLAVNGAKAQLRIGDKIIFSGGPSQPPEERDTGIVLDITPRINADGFITMEINVQQSRATFRDSDYPTIDQTNAKTIVQVRDGEEVLIGGLVSEVHNDTYQKIPFLGDLPLIKHFFRRTTKRPQSRELVILVTPRVVKQQIPGYTSPAGESPPGPGLDKPGGDDIFKGDDDFDDLLKGGDKKPPAGGGGDKKPPAGGGDKKPPKGGSKMDDLDDLDDLDDFK